MDYEAISKRTGGCGLYQYIVFTLLASSTFKMAVDFQGLSFALYELNYTCDLTNLSLPDPPSDYIVELSYDSCTYRLWDVDNSSSPWHKCSKWIYNQSEMTETLISDFNLVCDKAWYKDHLFSFFYIGALISSPLSMYSDRIGRKWLLICCVFGSVASSVWQALTWSLWQEIAGIMISGFCKSIYVGLAFTTTIELMPHNKIELAATNFWLFYAFGYMATAGFAYFTRSWRLIQLMSLLFSGLYLTYICMIPETPRWLMLKGRRKQAYGVLQFICRINRTKLTDAEFSQWHPIEESPGKFWRLLKSRVMVQRLAIMIFAAMTFSLAYIGSSTDLKFASDNIFVTTLVMGFIELPTGPLAALCSRKLSRKNAIKLLCGLGTTCLCLMPLIQMMINYKLSPVMIWPWLFAIVAMGSKLGFTSAWCLFDVITSELLPTTERNSGMTLIYFTVGMGSILAPMIHQYALVWHFAAPCFIYSALLIITNLLIVFFIPETKGLPLPQTIEQSINIKCGCEHHYKQEMIQDAKRRGTIDMTNLL